MKIDYDPHKDRFYMVCFKGQVQFTVKPEVLKEIHISIMDALFERRKIMDKKGGNKL